MPVFLYAGPGTSLLCVNETEGTLRSFGVQPVCIKEAKTLVESLQGTAKGSMVIIPGGRARPYKENLAGEGARIIRDFVHRGGNYLGIGAGAYFGSAKVEFELGTEIEVNEPMELHLFPGIAYGALYKRAFKYNSESGTSAAKIEIFGDTDLNLYYNGGCAFRNAESFPNVEVLAKYGDVEDKPAAVIKTFVGKGKVILSGVHCEVGSKAAEEEGASKSIIEKLEQTENERKEFACKILASCLDI